MKIKMTTEIIITVLLIGLAAGVLSGLVGIGGGIIMVPAMVIFLKYTQQQAQGTSLAVLALPVVILAALHYYKQCELNGYPIDLRVVGVLAIAFVIGAWFGGRIAMNIDQELLKRLFAILLFYTAFKMLNWDQLIIKLVKSVFS
jgi:uncharacterized membrane protein YfcA